MIKKTLSKTYKVFVDDIEQSTYTTINMAKPLYFWLVKKHPDKVVKIIKTQIESIEL